MWTGGSSRVFHFFLVLPNISSKIRVRFYIIYKEDGCKVNGVELVSGGLNDVSSILYLDVLLLLCPNDLSIKIKQEALSDTNDYNDLDHKNFTMFLYVIIFSYEYFPIFVTR